jgi:biofilm PGA synthesis N-glycosyltransferase PgaC
VAIFLIGFIAIIPGFMNAFIMSALALDKRPNLPERTDYPGVTVLIAAYNEASSIEDTVRSLMRQDYPGRLQVVVINDGSADATADIVRTLLPEFANLQLVDLKQNGGKAAALNAGLKLCETDYVITVDADCWIWKHGIRNIVGRRLADPPNTRAVAGAILIRNSRQNWLTKAQEWDYFLGIAVTKRIQSLFQGTLVAQGAFSLYDRTTLDEVGGWPHTVGEDIVLTWKILRAGYRVGHAENAFAMTRCPDTLHQFIRQRQRWSRGLIEAFKLTPGILLKRKLPVFYIWWNTLFPFMDLAYTIGFIPGVILACFGYFWIVGPMTLALLPMSFLMNWLMYSRSKATFDEMDLKVRRNRLGLVTYALVYSMILQPACVWGYVSELLNLRKTWGTK